MGKFEESLHRRDAINEGLIEHKEVEKEQEGMADIEKLLSKESGEKAMFLRHICKRVREGERVSYFQIEINKEALPNVLRQIFWRAKAYLEDNEGGRVIVDRPIYFIGDEVNYVPPGVPIIEEKFESYYNYMKSFGGQPDEDDLLQYDFSTKFVQRGDVKKIYPDQKEKDEVRPDDVLTESVVLEKLVKTIKKGWGQTSGGRKLELDGNKLTLDFSDSPSATFFEDILAWAIFVAIKKEGEVYEHKFLEPTSIVDIRFMFETDDDKKKREMNER